mgnify:FL=1
MANSLDVTRIDMTCGKTGRLRDDRDDFGTTGQIFGRSQVMGGARQVEIYGGCNGALFGTNRTI